MSHLVWLYELDGHPAAHIIEFTSTMDPSIPRRVVEHAASVWRRLDKELRVKGRHGLPLVSATVVYYGEEPWTGPRSTAEALPEEMKSLGFLMWYSVVDVLHDPLDRYSEAPYIWYMMRLARAREPEKALEVIRELERYLRSRGTPDLEARYAYFAATVLLGDELSEEEAARITELKQLKPLLYRKLERLQQEGTEEPKQ